MPTPGDPPAPRHPDSRAPACGSGRVLAGDALVAKTGTAEFGTATPPQTHAWMISWDQRYAIAAFVNQGESGSRSAAPLIKDFLAQG